jgi:signal peptidase
MNSAQIRDAIGRFRTSNHPLVALVRDLLWVFLVVGGIALTLYLVSGTWPAVVTVESKSMVPHMNVGDLVFVVEEDRFGPLTSWEQGKQTGFKSFGDYGDVIIYRPNGNTNIHPIIHRAMVYVEKDETIPWYINIFGGQSTPDRYAPASILNGQLISENGSVLARLDQKGIWIPTSDIGPGTGCQVPYEPARDGGYISKGDNNQNIDQVGSIQGIGQINPVDREWIVGKSLFAIPLLGYPALHLPEFAALIIVLLILHELYLSSREKREKTNQARSTRKKSRR